jgi:hypothetical protein
MERASTNIHRADIDVFKVNVWLAVASAGIPTHANTNDPGATDNEAGFAVFTTEGGLTSVARTGPAPPDWVGSASTVKMPSVCSRPG